jgi:hypothetical protein
MVVVEREGIKIGNGQDGAGEQYKSTNNFSFFISLASDEADICALAKKKWTQSTFVFFIIVISKPIIEHILLLLRSRFYAIDESDTLCVESFPIISIRLMILSMLCHSNYTVSLHSFVAMLEKKVSSNLNSCCAVLGFCHDFVKQIAGKVLREATGSRHSAMVPH